MQDVRYLDGYRAHDTFDMGLGNESARCGKGAHGSGFFERFVELSPEDAHQMLDGVASHCDAFSDEVLKVSGAWRLRGLFARLTGSLAQRDSCSPTRLEKDHCLDLAAELLDLFAVFFRTGAPVAGFALEGMEGRLLEALLNGRDP